MPSILGSRRLALRPGVPVLARSPGVIQVGLDEPSVRVDDGPDVARLLAALSSMGGLPEEPGDLAPAADRVLARLREAGLVVPIAAAERVADPSLTTLRAQFGPDAVRRQAARAEAAVAVRADAAAGALIEPLLAAAGLRAVDPGANEAAVELVVVTGTVARDRLDQLTRDSIAHLVVSGSAAGRRVGPFVDPGRTACLRCVDAHESLHDPRRPLLLAQAATASAAEPPPRDPLLDQLALAWAVRDLARFVEGDEPSTWSTTVDLGPGGAPEVTRWGRHPWCGCSWDAVLELP
ncbi:hypothetical protein [Nocardioides sp. SYSU DS0651]|uniref:hypothetical protein n=1 Tax=Nocardioides sp. SYSU DS0651 TaxID=3415955 RepID=UPI003F4BFD25